MHSEKCHDLCLKSWAYVSWKPNHFVFASFSATFHIYLFFCLLGIWSTNSCRLFLRIPRTHVNLCSKNWKQLLETINRSWKIQHELLSCKCDPGRALAETPGGLGSLVGNIYNWEIEKSLEVAVVGTKLLTIIRIRTKILGKDYEVKKKNKYYNKFSGDASLIPDFS